MSSKVNKAQKLVDETESLMKTNVSQMVKNTNDIESKLLPASQEIKAFAK